MTHASHTKRFPNESDEYRSARDRLLNAEAELRRQIEAVAAMRRSLPLGGQVKEDYTFDVANHASRTGLQPASHYTFAIRRQSR